MTEVREFSNILATIDTTSCSIASLAVRDLQCLENLFHDRQRLPRPASRLIKCLLVALCAPDTEAGWQVSSMSTVPAPNFLFFFSGPSVQRQSPEPVQSEYQHLLRKKNGTVLMWYRKHAGHLVQYFAKYPASALSPSFAHHTHHHHHHHHLLSILLYTTRQHPRKQLDYHALYISDHVNQVPP